MKYVQLPKGSNSSQWALCRAPWTVDFMCLFVVDRPEEVATAEEMDDPVNSLRLHPKYISRYTWHVRSLGIKPMMV